MTKRFLGIFTQRPVLPNIIEHSEFGLVKITVRRNSMNFSARWKDGRLTISVPYGSTESDIRRAIDELAPRLRKRRTTLRYKIGQRIELEGISFIFTHQSYAPNDIIATPHLPETFVEIGVNVDLDLEETTMRVSRVLEGCASKVAPSILLPLAQKISSAIGSSPKRFEIGRGHRVLGTCNTSGRIRLSHLLVFLSSDLREYIICHELAHLKEMNHSRKFHNICNLYCHGRERSLERELKKFEWPILR